MRIAFVSLMSGLKWGGSEVLWSSIADHALAQGNEVLISVYDWGNLHKSVKTLEVKGAKVLTRKLYKPESSLLKKIILFIRNRRPQLNADYQNIIKFNPDQIFISQGDTFDLAIHHKAFYKLISSSSIPFSLVCHSHQQYGFIPPPEIYPGAVEVFKNAQLVYFISKKQWHLTERRLILHLKNARFTWNPLNLKVPSEKSRFPSKETVQFAMVGNLSEQKGHDTALEVLSTGLWKERNWKLNIYGVGEGKKYLQDLAVSYRISDRVIFHGFSNDMNEAWQLNHILLIPSAGEGMPLSMVEAMACSRIVVAADVGGISEIITHNVNGFISASPAVDSFSNALEDCWGNKSNWSSIAERAFEKIKLEYEPNPHIKIYNELIKKNTNKD